MAVPGGVASGGVAALQNQNQNEAIEVQAQGGNPNKTACGYHNVYTAKGRRTWGSIPFVSREDAQQDVCKAQLAEAPQVSLQTCKDLLAFVMRIGMD